MASLPRVAVPTDRKQIGPHPFLGAGEKYLRALVEGAQVLPVLLPSLPGVDWQPLLADMDGILLTGAVSNIEPHHYGDEPSYPGNLHDPARDALTLPMVGQALVQDIPLLALCRGFQEVNVALGGSLHQKVHEQPGLMDHREDPEASLARQYAPAHVVGLVDGGWLSAIAGRDEVEVNSLHGQGVARLAPSLIVEATAPDGLVEAFRHDRAGFLLGVQWHPEWQVADNPFYLGIFQRFGDACRQRAARRQARCPT